MTHPSYCLKRAAPHPDFPEIPGFACTEPPAHQGEHVARHVMTGRVLVRWRDGEAP